MAAMNLDGDLAQSKLTGDLLVHQAGSDEAHHLSFALGQPLEACSQVRDSMLILPTLAVALEPAAATASSMSWSRNGLVRKSTAPAFMACTDIGISPCPVMNTIGRLAPVRASWAWNSSPLTPGRRISSTRQPGASAGTAFRNSGA